MSMRGVRNNKYYLVLILTFIFFLSLIPAVHSLTIDSCQELNNTGITYVLNQSVSIAGSTCFNITAANITLDCNRSYIVGDNSTDTYGIYSNQRNTTIKNCNIMGYPKSGIYLDVNSSNATLTNIIISNASASACTSAYAINAVASNYNFSNLQFANIHAGDCEDEVNPGGNFIAINVPGNHSMFNNITLNNNSHGLDLTELVDDGNGRSYGVQITGDYNQLKNVFSDEAVAYFTGDGTYNNISNVNANIFSQGVGIWISNTHATINNISVHNNFGFAIYLQNSNYDIVTNITTETDSLGGLALHNSKYNNFSNINATCAGAWCILIEWESNYNNITDSVGTTDNGYGIYILTQEIIIPSRIVQE